MISHDYKCIFIHIPRTGGTSFERAIFGGNWWAHHKETKHLLASQSKAIYKDYWDEYFKFTVVRNPWDRCISMLNFASTYYGASGNDITKEMLDWYKVKYNYPKTIEYDYRFYKLSEVLNNKHQENQVYGNILDEEIDYIAKFENLQNDYNEICKTIGLQNKDLKKTAKSSNRRDDYRSYYTDELREIVADLYKNDISTYQYEF